MIRPEVIRRSWTPKEDADLRRLHASGLSQRVIAQTIGRRASSVGCRARVLGLPPQPNKKCYGDPKPPEWPDMCFEDDPRALRREAPLRGDPVAARSDVGCAALMVTEA